jgi:hypothetical protein
MNFLKLAFLLAVAASIAKPDIYTIVATVPSVDTQYARDAVLTSVIKVRRTRCADLLFGFVGIYGREAVGNPLSAWGIQGAGFFKPVFQCDLQYSSIVIQRSGSNEHWDFFASVGGYRSEFIYTSITLTYYPGQRSGSGPVPVDLYTGGILFLNQCNQFDKTPTSPYDCAYLATDDGNPVTPDWCTTYGMAFDPTSATCYNCGNAFTYDSPRNACTYVSTGLLGCDPTDANCDCTDNIFCACVSGSKLDLASGS